MRAQYLFLFANLCHCPPAAVDRLTVGDFLSLIDVIDEVRSG